MRPITRDLLTGLTTIAAIASLIILLVVFGELNKVGKKFYAFELRIPSARGLTSTSLITLNGVRIGEIVEMENAENPRDGVDIRIEVAEDVVIPSDFEVFLNKGLIAGASLDLVTKVNSSAENVQPNDVFVRTPTGAMDEITAKLSGPLDTFMETAQHLSRLAETYDSLGKDLQAQISELLEPRTPQQVAAGAQPNLRSALTRFDQLANSADVLLSDDGIKGQALARLDDAGTLMEDLAKTSKEFRLAAADIRKQLQDASATIDALTSAAQQADQTLASINTGQGTLGQLMINPDLYHNLESASIRLESLLVEAQLLIEKFKAEGVPIQY